MSLALLTRIRAANASAPALVWRDSQYTYGFLQDQAAALRQVLAGAGVSPGATVSLEADYSPRAVAALLALLEHEAIVIPLGAATAESEALRGRAEVEVRLTVEAGEEIVVTHTGIKAGHTLYGMLRDWHHPGVVLFSSGSDGRPNAIVHDVAHLGARYERVGRASRICAFLAFDHIGGFNTLFYTLVNGGCLVIPDGRSPEEVCYTIASQRVDVLPTTPTFLNLLLLSDACERFDLSSLALVTYGTEVMPLATLERLCARLPRVRLLQTYGLSETGILATRSPNRDSVWFTISAPDVETRIIDGVLHVRAPTTMLGYIDGASERLLADGWFNTGDLVECRDDLIRVLGRTRDVINVGGEKVHATEVENVILELDGVVEARVSGETNALTGQHVRLEVVLSTAETAAEFRRRLRRHGAARLEAFKVPQRVIVVDHPLHGKRYKKVRRADR